MKRPTASSFHYLQPYIPRHRFRNPFGQPVCRREAQQVLRLGHIGLAVAHVTGAEVAVHRLGVGAHAVGCQIVAQQGEQAVERGSFADGDVVDLVARFGVLRGGGQQVGLHGVVDKAEVAAGFAVAVDEDGFALEQRGGPFGETAA